MAYADATALTPINLSEKAAVSVATLTAVDGTDGNSFNANAKTLLRVVNAAGAPITVTVHTNRSVEGLAVADDTFSVPATTGDVIYSGFSNIFHWNDTGGVWVEFSSGTSVTAQVIQPE